MPPPARPTVLLPGPGPNRIAPAIEFDSPGVPAATARRAAPLGAAGETGLTETGVAETGSADSGAVAAGSADTGAAASAPVRAWSVTAGMVPVSAVEWRPRRPGAGLPWQNA